MTEILPSSLTAVRWRRACPVSGTIGIPARRALAASASLASGIAAAMHSRWGSAALSAADRSLHRRQKAPIVSTYLTGEGRAGPRTSGGSQANDFASINKCAERPH